jgi:hypothetical protein
MEKETLEEAAEKYANSPDIMSTTYLSRLNAFKGGATWQAERMYSEEEVLELLNNREQYLIESVGEFYQSNLEWFEQIKKK